MMFKQYDTSQLKSCGIDTRISENVEIHHPQLVSIGSHCAIDSGFYCTVSIEIGDYVHIGPHVTIIGSSKGILRMGNFTNIAAGSQIICGSDEYLGKGLIGPSSIPEKYRDKIILEPVVFEDFANIGANTVVHPGVTLSIGSVVGSCSLVTRDTLPWNIHYGVPAVPVKERKREEILKAAKALGY